MTSSFPILTVLVLLPLAGAVLVTLTGRRRPDLVKLIAGYDRSVMFQQVSDYNAPRWPDPAHPQQAHLDILIDDLDAGEARALELGASRLDGGGQRSRVFADPAGHPFDLTL